MYSTHNEVKSVIGERSIRILKSKIYKKMTANNSKYYLGYLNKLVYEYINTYHLSIPKKTIDPDYSALTEKIGTNPKAPKFKVGDRDRVTKYKKVFSKSYTNNWSREIFVIDFVLKTDTWMYKTKDLNRKPIIRSFY